MAAVARRPGPSLRTVLFWRGDRAVCELWRLEDRSGSLFLEGSESNVRQWGPWPAGPVRPSGWKTAKRVSFLVGAESDVRH